MPIVERKYCVAPPGETHLWRYVEEWKLVHLLETHSLHFVRADLAGDDLEGSYTASNVALSERVCKEMFGEETGAAWTARLRAWNKAMPTVFVNCWHANRGESSAMWELYAGKENGLAIQTTVERMKAAVNDERPVHLSAISYIDFETERFQPGNGFPPFLHKALHLSWESEVRLLFPAQLPCTYLVDPPPADPETAGVEVRVDPTTLIESLWVGPNQDRNRSDELKALLEQHAIDCSVNTSKIGEPARY